MIIGIKLMKRVNNIIQYLYYIFILLLREKTNIKYQIQIQEMVILLLYPQHKYLVYLFYVVLKMF